MKGPGFQFHWRTSYRSGREVERGTKSKRPKASLPPPDFHGDLLYLLSERRSRRVLKGPVSVQELASVLWAANGVTLKKRFVSFRTAPSAGALYCVENYVSVQNVEDIKAGIYRYLPEEHALKPLFEGDHSRALKRACLDQDFVGEAAFNILWTVVVQRFIAHYSARGWRYAFLDAGHIAENAFLACEALGLGACPVGAFYDDEISGILDLQEGEYPLYLLAVGKRKK